VTAKEVIAMTVTAKSSGSNKVTAIQLTAKEVTESIVYD
jgi:hypothetical protein